MNPIDQTTTVSLVNNRVVAIDGGTATGKGRLIEELTVLLRSHGIPVIHLSTGSVFRAAAWAAMDAALARRGQQMGLDPETNHWALERLREMDEETVMKAAREYEIAMHGGLVWIRGQEASVEGQLKAPAVGTGSAVTGGIMAVRQFMNDVTRRQVNEFDGYVLIDGRDITHTVVPDAPLKLLLTVTPEVASKRSVEHTIEEIIARDKVDRSRKYGALRHADNPGEDVIVLPTDNHTPESVRDHVYGLMREVFPLLPEI